MSLEAPTTEEEVLGNSEQDIHLEEVAELELPIKRIIEKMRPRIEAGDYGLVIGDDASGRIPALILGNFIGKVSEQKGQQKPNIIFIPGKLKMESNGFFNETINLGKKKQHQELGEYISKQGVSKDKIILIVTDTIQSGFSLKTMIQLLKRAGYRCDIAMIGIEQPMIGRIERNKNLSGADIFSGEYSSSEYDSHTPLIYGREDLSGVYKNPGDKVSKTLKSSALPEGTSPEDVNPESINTDSSRQEIQESINQSRKDANIVVDHLVDWYNLNNE